MKGGRGGETERHVGKGSEEKRESEGKKGKRERDENKEREREREGECGKRGGNYWAEADRGERDEIRGEWREERRRRGREQEGCKE